MNTTRSKTHVAAASGYGDPQPQPIARGSLDEDHRGNLIQTTTPVDAVTITIRQFSRWGVIGVWAAAAIPMGILAWVVTPVIASNGDSTAVTVALVGALTVGLVWQCLLAVGLVAVEQYSLRWRVLRQALWLTPPTNATGRRGGRLWLWLIPFIIGFALVQLIPFGISELPSHSFGSFLNSPAGHDLLRGNWAFLGLIIVMFTFNTILGEELLFRGVLLPRMRGAFGRSDWLINGLLFALYHLHQPWSIPSSAIGGTLCLAYPTARWRSAWMGIIVHSTQSVFLLVLILATVIL